MYSEVLGLTDFFMKTDAELQARKKALHSNSDISNRPVLDGDLITMVVKFERFVISDFLYLK